MSQTRSDQVWESLAQEMPYWAVLSMDQFRPEALGEGNLKEFFASGEGWVEFVLGRIRTLDPGFTPRSAIDFGCGVGRITLPLSRRVDRVYSIDVSPTMLELCRANCERDGRTNVTRVRSTDDLGNQREPVDLVVSTITFQHIPEPRGLAILGQLLGRLNPGGWACLYLLFRPTDEAPPAPRPGTESPLEEQIEMNPYDLSRVLCLAEPAADTAALSFHRMGSLRGCDLFLRKRRVP